jgi:hypothetical protein
MVTFVTFFLALVAGVHPVELAVDDSVSRVVLYLDQEPIGAVEGPPWRFTCDFGIALAPHELEAVAYDDAGLEVGRASQVVNLPRALAEITIAFDTGDDGMPVAARLYWESGDRSEPLSVFALLDGVILRPDAKGRYLFPDYDPAQVHIVSAEARFPDEITARADATFGGQYGARVTSELTAVPIVSNGRKRPTVQSLQGLLHDGGTPLAVAAVEQPRSQIFMVRDHASLAKMLHLRRRQEHIGMPVPHRRRRLGSSAAAPDEDRVHAVVPNPVPRADRMLFPTSPSIGLDQWPLPWLATHLTGNEAALEGQMIADAVAVAGNRAGADGTPRTVLVILSDEPRDLSGFTFDQVRQYLRQIRVPLYVWTVGGRPATSWGPTVDVSSYKALKRASEDLLDELSRQWIVWVEGSHMINRIELAPEADGIRLAGVDG